MKLYRIAKARYASDIRGTGGLYEAGRWHREGTLILYTSEVVSLAMLEVLSHWQHTPAGLSLITLDVPENASTTTVDPADLPPQWRELPYLPALADLTAQWIRDGTYWLLKVPSVHSPAEFNYLLNPLHPEHTTLQLISIEPHPFDARLK